MTPAPAPDQEADPREPTPITTALPFLNQDNNAPPPTSTAPTPPNLHTPKPLLRLECRDLSHPGASLFLQHHHPTIVLTQALSSVLDILYRHPDSPPIPPTRSVTLVLRALDGVAYTTSLDLDADHKEIHLNTSYIASIPSLSVKNEIQGVVTHEVVHCFQYNGHGTAPGGLIEGIADYVRLKAGLAPAHWKRTAEGTWDQGYERTAWFLVWLEERYGRGFVRGVNERLRTCRYEEVGFWEKCCGRTVRIEELWREYGVWLGKCERGWGVSG
ncbi:BSP-domain-containing protein [Sporormia fimetaria CBS 119925]|uniref:BSP-domain-containing protein n=1 Tax=Sporormia fimetaria CBS 119925 TaxID=1340428 RepID=A0A6A6VD64_9PLEO|nr:BSP-domain-containing protein [Sporormia fimetaria CBS 119925]